MAQGQDILALCGSIRTGSVNRKLLQLAIDYLKSEGVPVRFEDLKSFDLPIYNGDIESSQGIPENAKRLRGMVDNCRGLLVFTPEYNGSVTPLLKNVIDWTSRPFDGNGPSKVYRDKIVCLAGASMGGSGALRGLAHIAAVFSNMGSVVVPQFFGLSFAGKALTENDTFSEEKIRDSFFSYIDTFVAILNKPRKDL